MAEKTITGVGTQLLRHNGVAYVQIGEVANIEGPSASKETVDTTHLLTTGKFRTFIDSFIDAGEVTFTMHFKRTDYFTLLADFKGTGTHDWQIVFPDDDATTLYFSAIVTGIPLTIPPDDKVTVAVTLKVSGEITTDEEESSA